jgi:hypothetical protein
MNTYPCELEPIDVEPTADAGSAALETRKRVTVSSTTIRAPPVLSDTTNAIWVEPRIAVPVVAAVSSVSIALDVKKPVAVSRLMRTPLPEAFTPIAQLAVPAKSETHGEVIVVPGSIAVAEITYGAAGAATADCGISLATMPSVPRMRAEISAIPIVRRIRIECVMQALHHTQVQQRWDYPHPVMRGITKQSAPR